MGAGTILIVAFISAGLGYVAGLILTRNNKSKEETPQVDGIEGGPRYEAHKLTVTLWSKTPEGPLLADLYGHTIHKRDDIVEPEKNRLIQDLRAIEAWFGLANLRNIPVSLPAQVAEPVKVEQAVNQSSAPIQEAIVETNNIVLQPAQVNTATSSPELSQNVPSSGAVQQQDLPLKSALPPTARQIEDLTPPPPVSPVQPRLDNRPKAAPVIKSIVEQINDILQDKVAVSPLAEVGVKLQESPQGVLVWIGNQSYQGVDTVPEGDAKALIRAAVNEWERR
jgi:hypothetical protein